jgi:tripartite-type tricarboxylate transporter receptor subunit TctC
LRGLALASTTRSAAVPGVPTFAEMGFPNMLTGSWVGFFAPAKTSDAIVTKLSAEMNEILKLPDVQEKLKSIGFDPILKSHAETVAYFKSEVETWGKMVRAIGMTTN